MNDPTTQEYLKALIVVKAYKESKLSGESVCPFCNGSKTKPFTGSSYGQTCRECNANGMIKNKTLYKLGLYEFIQKQTPTPQPVVSEDSWVSDPFLSQVIPMGKYKGQTLEFVMNNNPSYIAWLHSNNLCNIPDHIALIAKSKHEKNQENKAWESQEAYEHDPHCSDDNLPF